MIMIIDDYVHIIDRRLSVMDQRHTFSEEQIIGQFSDSCCITAVFKCIMEGLYAASAPDSSS